MSTPPALQPQDERPRHPILAAATGFLARSLAQISTLALTLIAGVLFAPADYAVYSLSVAVMALVQITYTTGFYHFIVTAQEPDEDRLISTCFWLMLGLAGAATGAALLAGPVLARALDEPRMAVMILLVVGILPPSVLTSWGSAVLLRRQRLQADFLIQIVQSLVGMVAAVAALLVDQSIYALAVNAIARVLTGCLLYPLVLRRLPGPRFDPDVARPAIRYASGLYGSAFLSYLGNYAADLVLGFLVSTASAGLYRFANRLAVVAIEIVATPMRSFALSQLGAARRKGQALGGLVADFLATQAVLTGLVTATLLVLLADTVRGLFDPLYGAAVGVSMALAVKTFATGPSGLVQPVFAAQARNWAALRFYAGWTIAQLAAVAALAPVGLQLMAWVQAGLAAAASLHGMRLIAREADLPFTTLARRLLAAMGFGAGFALVLMVMRAAVLTQFGPGRGALAVELGLALVLGLSALALALRLRLVHLRVFAG